jgi:hypothetical protein
MASAAVTRFAGSYCSICSSKSTPSASSVGTRWAKLSGVGYTGKSRCEHARTNYTRVRKRKGEREASSRHPHSVVREVHDGRVNLSRRRAQQAEDAVELIRLRRASEQRATVRHFGEDAAHAPNVNRRRVFPSRINKEMDHRISTTADGVVLVRQAEI